MSVVRAGNANAGPRWKAAFARIQAIWSRSKPWLQGRDADSILINQPMRALSRSILWFAVGVGLSLPFLGLACGLAAGIGGIDPGIQWLLANLAGLFLSGLLTQALLIVVCLVMLVAGPILRSTSVPRPMPGPRP